MRQNTLNPDFIVNPNLRIRGTGLRMTLGWFREHVPLPVTVLPGADDNSGAYLDSMHCLCGNSTISSGFLNSMPDGTTCEGDEPSTWEEHFLCVDCGLVYAGKTHRYATDEWVVDATGWRDLSEFTAKNPLQPDEWKRAQRATSPITYCFRPFVMVTPDTGEVTVDWSDCEGLSSREGSSDVPEPEFDKDGNTSGGRLLDAILGDWREQGPLAEAVRLERLAAYLRAHAETPALVAESMEAGYR